MGFPGPFSISPINNTPDQELGLRVFQRITAQVLSVTGTTAVLEVDGHPVVAQLTSADQAAILSSQGTAQFIITELTSQSITLKFIRDEQPQSALIGVVANGPELAERILENNNLPVTVTNLMMTRSMLKQHLPITPGLLKELLGALSDDGQWSEVDADLATAMKSAGLPVTAQSLALASRPPVQTAQSLSRLIEMLTQASIQNLPDELLEQLKSNLQALNSLILKGDEKPRQVADQLKALVDAFGRSLENILLEQIQNPAKPIPEKSLVSLVKLQQMLEQFGKQETAQSIKEFLNEIRQNQFMNVKPDPVPGQGEWSEIGFMIQSAAQKAEGKFSSARLKIAHETKKNSSKINPAYTRLILQVDLEPGKTVEVDLSLVGKQIRTSVMAPNPAWRNQAQDELPSLVGALKDLGYALKDFQVDVGEPQPLGRIKLASDNAHLMTVNIEV
jgi:hypothetical protein